MLPVILTIAGFPITSFGLFLTLAFLAALFIIWRSAQVYEIEGEKLLDLFFLTIFCGFIAARIYFLLFHLDYLSDPLKIILFNRYPGFSFWGGLVGAIFGLWFFSKRLKLNLWQVLDFASVGLFIGLVLSSLGCFLGSCQYGVLSNSPFGITQVGIIGQRFPIQILEGALFLWGFLYLWKKLLRFHFAGSITAQALILLGLIKFLVEFYRGDIQKVPFFNFSFGFIWSFLCLIFGMKIYYRQARKSFAKDLGFIASLSINAQRRNIVVSTWRKSCYNLFINLKFSLKHKWRNLFKSLNVKSNPTKF